MLKTLTPFKATSILLLALSSLLFSPASQAQMKMDSSHPPMAQGGSGSMDMMQKMKENSDKMQGMQMTGDPDVDFAQMMRTHHKGAIDMAEIELKNGKDSRMKSMAKSIIAAQRKEIAQFDKFLSQQRGGN